MSKTMFLAAALSIAATPALAQNELAPALGQLTGQSNAASGTRRAVTFTVLGTYADVGQQRLIDVRSDRDNDGDDVDDAGIFSVTCNGGDTLAGTFAAGQSTQGKGKLVHAPAASPLASGKTFIGSWDAKETTPAGTPVMIGVGQPNLCAGHK